MSKDVLVYRIDSADTIVSVSDNWQAFADANAWSSLLRPENVVGHSIWEFIQGLEMRYLYQELFRRVRQGISSRAIPFRCDSPGERRFLELYIKLLPEGQIEISSMIRRSEARSPVRLLDEDTSRSAELVTLCSMCKKIKVSPEQWAEIEEGLSLLKIFEADEMPQLSHGLCQYCCDSTMNN
ncbi:MAG: hypothetical protein CVU43_18610 [Chloroflexi bacterium HGW-Chloroflexi-5]|jgi:hypothetical protein|nr:MAG: hypothetical protein CVU43_18610 [Chloroflexi bacterium HGW-Chloroflexi-5]